MIDYNSVRFHFGLNYNLTGSDQSLKWRTLDRYVYNGNRGRRITSITRQYLWCISAVFFIGITLT